MSFKMLKSEMKSRIQGSRPRTDPPEAKDRNAQSQGTRTQRGSDLQKKSPQHQNFANFPEISSVLQEKICLQKIFCKLSGVFQDETQLVMTLANFQQVKK